MRGGGIVFGRRKREEIRRDDNRIGSVWAREEWERESGGVFRVKKEGAESDNLRRRDEGEIGVIRKKKTASGKGSIFWRTKRGMIDGVFWRAKTRTE